LFNELDEFEKMRDEFINHDDFFKGINNEDINLENE